MDGEDLRHDKATTSQARRREDRLNADLKFQALIDLPPDERYKKIMAMTTADQLAFAEPCAGPKARIFSLAWIPGRKKLCWP